MFNMPNAGRKNKTLFENDRQAFFMLFTGLSFTCMTALRGPDRMLSNLIRLASGFVATMIFFSAALCTMTLPVDLNTPIKTDRLAVISKKGCLKIHPQPAALFIMLVGLNYVSARVIEWIVSIALSSEITNATGFVVANLIAIYPSKNLSNGSYTNANTIAGFVGLITFCICATAVYFTKSHSSNNAMLMLKGVPIFVACMLAIYQEQYGVKDELEIKPDGQVLIKSKGSAMGSIINCLLGSSIITAGFVSSDLFTRTLASSSILNNSGIAYGMMKFAIETLLTPSIVIIASLICRYTCNNVGELCNRP